MFVYLRRSFALLAASLFTMLFFCQCSNSKGDDFGGYGSEYPHTREAISIIDSCMSFMQADPARSHHIIDSVCQAQLMSPQRCDYYHAMVLYMGDEMRDSALSICNRLLDEGRFGDDRYLEEEVCVLASNITLTVGRFIETLEYANRGIAICHGQEVMASDEATLMGRAGQAQQMLGRPEEAMQTYEEANELLRVDKTFGGLIARISLMMKQTTLYYETADYDKMIDTCHAVLALVEGFHRDPSAVASRPHTMTTSGQATRDFADFYQSQMYGKIAKAYLGKAERADSQAASPWLDSLNLYLDKWEQTQSYDMADNLERVMRALYVTGRTDLFNKATQAVADLYKGDSLVAGYEDCLHLLAEDAASRHDYAASTAYLQRALAISDSIRQRETVCMLSEQMSVYMVQQQQLARREAESRASHYKLAIAIIVIVVIVVMSGIAIVVLRRRNKRQDEMLQTTRQDLQDTKEEVEEIIHQLEESRQEKQVRNLQELYERIEQVFNEKRYYLNPDFNIAMLAEELRINRTFISASINTVTGKTFRTWLAEYRLNLFLAKQEEAPETPIEQLLLMCGYKDQSTFRRQFKTTFGTTPSRYKKGSG